MRGHVDTIDIHLIRSISSKIVLVTISVHEYIIYFPLYLRSTHYTINYHKFSDYIVLIIYHTYCLKDLQTLFVRGRFSNNDCNYILTYCYADFYCFYAKDVHSFKYVHYKYTKLNYINIYIYIIFGL